jgi:hypothetical protein
LYDARIGDLRRACIAPPSLTPPPTVVVPVAAAAGRGTLPSRAIPLKSRQSRTPGSPAEHLVMSEIKLSWTFFHPPSVKWVGDTLELYRRSIAGTQFRFYKVSRVLCYRFLNLWICQQSKRSILAFIPLPANGRTCDPSSVAFRRLQVRVLAESGYARILNLQVARIHSHA